MVISVLVWLLESAAIVWHMDIKTTKAKGEVWDDGFPCILEPLPFG